MATDVALISDRTTLVSWTALANGATGGGAQLFEHADRSVQVTGTFGAGGTVVIQGSNDGSTWATLNDPNGNALSITSAKIEAVLELTRYIRPSVTAGDGTTAINVYLFARKG